MEKVEMGDKNGKIANEDNGNKKENPPIGNDNSKPNDKGSRICRND